LQFHALALDGAGKPLPVMHSDEGFALLFAKPDAAHLELAVTSSLRPFPAGLLTGVGMVVANPAFAPAALQSGFSRNAYHGTVVWSWQQALFAAGLERQLHRTDLTPELRSHLQQAQRLLWGAIAATQAQRNSELWSWNFTGGRYVVNAFGAEAADADESNAAQLWSTVYLAVQPPR
jgi:glycogen debranching enzyme